MVTKELGAQPFIQDRRKSIDALDCVFLTLLSERMRLVEKIIYLKQKNNLDLKPGEQRKKDMDGLLTLASEIDLGPDLFGNLLDLVFHEAVERFEQGLQHHDTTSMDEICEGLKLDDLRENLLNLEQSMCLILAERFRTVKLIGKYKKKRSIPPLDSGRWQKVLDAKVQQAERLGLDAQLVCEIYERIHRAALDIEGRIETV